MDNPYQASHTLSEADLDMGETYQPKFFSWHGRIGRLRYFGYLVLAYILITSLLGFLMGLLVVPLTALVGKDNLTLLTGGLVLIFLGMAGIILAKRRFNDMGYSGWLSVLSIIPLLNLIVGLMLICKRGDEFRNAYGKPPGPNSGWIWLTILIIPMIGILAAIALPAYQSFTKRAKQAAQSQQAPIAAPAESNGAGRQ